MCHVESPPIEPHQALETTQHHSAMRQCHQDFCTTTSASRLVSKMTVQPLEDRRIISKVTGHLYVLDNEQSCWVDTNSLWEMQSPRVSQTNSSSPSLQPTHPAHFLHHIYFCLPTSLQPSNYCKNTRCGPFHQLFWCINLILIYQPSHHIPLSSCINTHTHIYICSRAWLSSRHVVNMVTYIIYINKKQQNSKP